MATLALCAVSDVFLSPALDEYRATTAPDPTADLQEFIQRAILAFSDYAERRCSRWFAKTTYTEVFSVSTGQQVLCLHAYPVSSITSVKIDSEANFAATTALDSTSYALLSEGRTGRLKLRTGYGSFVEGTGSVQVVYVGGLADKTDEVPADLQLAAIEQVVFTVKRAANAHLKSEGQGGGSVTYFRDAPLLQSVEDVLGRYETIPF